MVATKNDSANQSSNHVLTAGCNTPGDLVIEAKETVNPILQLDLSCKNFIHFYSICVHTENIVRLSMMAAE